MTALREYCSTCGFVGTRGELGAHSCYQAFIGRVRDGHPVTVPELQALERAHTELLLACEAAHDRAEQNALCIELIDRALDVQARTAAKIRSIIESRPQGQPASQKHTQDRPL
jgi:hypothetical protein